MKLCKEDLLINIVKFKKGIFHSYCLSKDLASFHNLQGKLDPLIVREPNNFFEDLLQPLVRKLFLHWKEATLHL